MKSIHRRWARPAVIGLTAAGLGIAINFATELKTSWWAWLAVGVLTVAGIVVGAGADQLRRVSRSAPSVVNKGTLVTFKGEKNRVKIVSTGPGALIAVGLVVILSVLLGQVAAWFALKDRPTGNPPPDNGSPFVVTVLTDRQEAEFGINLGRPSDYVFPPGAVRSLPPPQPVGKCFAWQRWAEEHGGVQSFVTNIAFTIAALDQHVRVHGARLIVEPQQRAATGDRVGCIQGGPIPVSRLEIDLDSQKSTYKYPDESTDAGQERPFALEIEPGKAERVAVKAHSLECYCRWYIELRLEVNGVEYSHRVDNNGQPFVTAPLRGKYTDFAYDLSTQRWVEGIG